ncbi:Lrp/AsnC family transcriptional regulator [Promethearchaeum syntrophicum]|uniref:Lrp/AsnC family transcriptional regulator n=1 Tax=Promethearchaeum syntrophicum TaxID=2594042 RepID=A0A5B9D822_9ARCH|nr:Lrp/AsnC family transcriptional regulator [Candidatus Prometheoarchaeum syntrophicum]QEE15319.1 putative HTH-type transcriptional regulator [Candidatus Prometheoarchaeum syntrophicum]
MGKKEVMNNISNGTNHKAFLDEIDKKILTLIQEDGKASLRTISKTIGSSISTVKNHLDRLNEIEVIKRTIAVVDCCKIGYTEMILISIRVNSSVGIQEILDHLEEIEQINAIYQVSGNYPIFCFAKCVEKEDQINLLEDIKKTKGIDEAVTQIVLKRVKEDMRVKIP